METVRVQTSQNVGLAYEVAGLGDRLLALVVDYLILLAWVVGAYFVGANIIGMSSGLWSLISLSALLYFPLFHIVMDGQTVGKHLSKIKVARLDGEPVTIGNYLIRWLFRIVEVEGTLGVIAFLGYFLSARGQRFGDRAAGTLVVKVQARTELRDTVFAEVAEAYEPVFTQADLLTPDDILMTKDVMAALRAEGRTVASRDLGDQMKAALEQRMGIQSNLPTYEFLRTVVRDYNAVHGRIVS